ncbi:PREDICTED: protein FAM210A isoform X2 [Dufourea novaeangliae]|uniref:protein FAM210A isoform X2 n=1 Tax=Dufourea novaeangliae TaxID=178035 RepID=UPI000767298F|nr:PREDICTED: protein FAM210A isoform X2 [Dufourea novaeangliae]
MEVILGRSTTLTSTLGFGPMFINKNLLETVRFMRCTDPKRWKLKLPERYPRYGNLSCNSVPIFNRITTNQLPLRYNITKSSVAVTRYCDSKQCTKDDTQEPQKKLSVFAKMKQLTKDYWHVLVPVHIITSVGWVAIFYVTIKNGVNIAKIMEFMHFGQKYLDMVQNSRAGNWALTYALYKMFTPLRYTVTIGLTTMTIRQLSKSGLVKPLPWGKQRQVTPKPACDALYNRIK